MDSATNRLLEETRKQQEIRNQIALLQAQLKDSYAEPTPSFHTPPQKRKKPEPTLLAPATPSPKKKRRVEDGSTTVTFPKLVLAGPAPRTVKPIVQKEMSSLQPAPSNVLSKLASLHNQSCKASPAEDILRSVAFTEKPQLASPARDHAARQSPEPNGAPNAPQRDDRLALVEDLEPGPYDHKAPFDDPHFEQLEPNSGIRLLSRRIPNDDIQEYLTGRFYLSPSRLYSAIRLLPHKQGYDVPVPGDWVTIAVVAERGPIRFSRAPAAISRDDDGNGLEEDDDPKSKPKPKPKPKGKPKADSPPKSGKKYVNIKLIDFGERARCASSATGGKAVIRGDAFLSLLLFESDGFDLTTKDEGGRPQKVYKGGSRGAFEELSKLKEGDVVALLNPKVLKPFQGPSDSPHPVNNILAITPESAGSIIVIGRARDLGMCTVTKRDGKLCGSWCDKRVSDVCEWHVQNAVESRRAARPEFSIGSSGMSTTTATRGRKAAYDPQRQWGLKPEPAQGTGSTYVLSGHIISSSGSDSRSLFVAENIGREGQAKAQSKIKRADEDRELKRLLERDKEGMMAVIKAREVAAEMEEVASDKGKGKERAKDGKKSAGAHSEKGKPTKNKNAAQDNSQDAAATTHKSYSAAVIRGLGFDPSIKPGQQRVDDSAVQKKLEALASFQSTRKEIALGPRPGQRIRSGVFAPPHGEVPKATEKLVDLDDF